MSETKEQDVFRRTRSFDGFRQAVGDDGLHFLIHALTAIARLLPHTETTRWKLARKPPKNKRQANTNRARVKWASSDRRELNLAIDLHLGSGTGDDWGLTAQLARKRAAAGVGNIPRTVDHLERDICERVLGRLSNVLGSRENASPESLTAILGTFDEQIVASHLKSHHDLQIDVAGILRSLRELAEQSYENKSLTFGCLLDPNTRKEPPENASFPAEVLQKKKYRALSDGFRTAYRVSSLGRVVGFEDLDLPKDDRGTHYYPEWCERIAAASRNGVCGICLTRQGDILLFDAGTMRFTYRGGRWQYWNHTHIVDLLRNRARAQRVPPRIIGNVVNSIYRAALDVAFRRCGGLFVLLHNRASVSKMAHPEDTVSDGHRGELDTAFDEALPSLNIRSMSRRIMVELAGLDGGVVLDNHGDIMAYAAVLNPKKRGRIGHTEGSRSKAAIGASKYGIAVKISSDGDIKCYEKGRAFFAT
jgi:hypothetical protein